jgi:hypothetical protein
MYTLYKLSHVYNCVVTEVLCYKPEGRGFETRRGQLISSMYLILSAAMRPWVQPGL